MCLRLFSGVVLLASAMALPARGQAPGPMIPVPETIRAEGVPPIPAEVGRALSRYQEIRSATFEDWASDGSGMYVLTRFADVPQVHIVATAGGARTQLTFLKERVRSVVARPRHDQFLYVADEGGAENDQIFLQDRKTGRVRRITDGKSRNVGPKWSPTGTLLAWSSNARNSRDMDLYVAAPDDPHFVRRFKEVSGQWTVSDWSPDGSKVVAVEYRSIEDSRIHVVEVDTGKARTIAPDPDDPKAGTSSNGDARWSPDGKSIYYLSDLGQDFRYLVRHDSEKDTSLTTPVRDIEAFDLSDDGRAIVVVANQQGASRIVYAMDPREIQDHSNEHFGRAAEDARPLFIRGTREFNISVSNSDKWHSSVISALEFRPGSQVVGFTLSGAANSSDAYAFELNYSGYPTPIRWTTSETAGLDTDAFPEPERVEYESFDGRKIPAFVYRPTGDRRKGPSPVLIDIHGGPESQFRPRFLGRLNYLVNELGLVLICPNVRGSSGYGKSYLKLDNGKLRGDAVKDIGALLDWIAKQKDLDKARVGVMGGSYGGFMSLAVQTTYNDRIRAGIDVVGISNFVSFLENTQGYRRDLRRAEYGDERDPETRAVLEKVSPLSQAEKIRTPILIVQGKNDPRVPFSESEQMAAAVRKNRVPVWYVVGTNEGHGFAKKANQDYLQAVEVAFLRRYLIGSDEHQAREVATRFPVSGTIMVGGRPIPSGKILLNPTVPGGRPASGEIRDGRFTLTTETPGDGAMPGTYKVTIISDAKVPARYASPETSALMVKIRASGNVLDFRIP